MIADPVSGIAGLAAAFGALRYRHIGISEAADATAVTVVSIRAAATNGSLSASLVTASLAEGKIDFVFNPSLPPGAYDLIIRLTRADGSTLELPFTVFMGEGPD